MTPEQGYAFTAFALVAAITPGPSNVMLTATGAIAGVRGGLPCLLGVGAGMALMMFAVAFGLGSLVLGHPMVVAALKWCGAAFLLWLSWKIATAEAGNAAADARPVGFLGAAAFQWLNPKAWLISTSAAVTYLEGDGTSALTQALSMAGLFFAVAAPCSFVWLAFGVAMRRMLRSPRALRALNIGMGALLAGSVVLIVW